MAQPTSALTILHIVNAVAHMERIRRRPLGLRSQVRLCPLHRELDDVSSATEGAWARVTRSELVSSTSDIIPLTEIPR